MAVERAKGQYCFGTPAFAIMHRVTPVTVPNARSILPFSLGVLGAENSCLMPLDELNCFDLNSRAWSETTVPGRPISMMNRCNFAVTSSFDFMGYTAPKRAVTIDEAHCIAKPSWHSC